MAENESLDLGGAYANRWDAVFASVNKGASTEDVAKKVERALYSGIRKTLKQLQEYGVSLADLLAQRHSGQALRQFVRRTQGHQYVQLFQAAAAASGPTEGECLRSWVDSILDKVMDQICHRVAGTEHWPSFFDVQEFTREVRQTMEPEIERIVMKFENNPNWQPKRAATKGEAPTNATADLMGMSLLGVHRQ